MELSRAPTIVTYQRGCASTLSGVRCLRFGLRTRARGLLKREVNVTATKTSSNDAGAEPSEMCDMQPPHTSENLKATLVGPPVSPQGRIQLYNDVEWEEFIREWVTALETAYVQIKRFGGTGDRGADVAVFKSDRGLEGPWDCFQGKHYANPLTFGDASPEMLKVFRAVIAGDWTMPDTYQFLAPRGCGTQLNQLLSQPAKLKARFLKELKDPGKPLGKALDAAEQNAIVSLASQTDFTMFKSVELLDALAQHATTPYYVARFGTHLADRPAHQTPPAGFEPTETRYVEQLLKVYNERHPGHDIRTDNVSSHNSVAEHFQRQREAFYKAESLRVYARDSVPPGTFDLLQDDIHAGVIDIADDTHPDGWTRLSKVLAHVGSLDLNRHTLIQVSNIEDRKGICHQLANADRVTWVGPQ